MASDAEHLFICLWALWALCMSSLEKCLFKSFAHFLIGLFVFLEFFIYVWVLYIFWRSGPCLRYPWQICFPIRLVFILILFSLAMQKLFILMRSHLFILSFMSLALGDISVKILLHEISEIFLPMFSSMTLMVSRLIFKSFIHPEFIFVYGVSWWLNFIFGHEAVQISQHHLLQTLFLLHFILLPPSSNINWS